MTCGRLTDDKVQGRADEVGDALQDVDDKGEDAVGDRVDDVEDTLHEGKGGLEDALETVSTVRLCGEAVFQPQLLRLPTGAEIARVTYLNEVEDTLEEVGHGVYCLVCC